MGNIFIIVAIGVLTLCFVGGLGFVFVSAGGDASKKRLATVVRPTATSRVVKGAQDNNQQRRKNVQSMLKELEQKQAESKKRISLRRRIEMAGLEITPKTFWLWSLAAGVVSMLGAFLGGAPLYAVPMAGFAGGLGLPRWVLGFLKKRRENAFTREFAPAIDVIVRSVKSGLPVNEALKVVSTEIPDPVGSEFKTFVENLKVGITSEQGLKRMFERMPTAEVNFFGIVMTIQQKSGGNLSEALQNLANVLRDRKRLQGKIRAMSQEAKTSAWIIGSLPPGVTGLIYLTAPTYINSMFETQIGNLMLMGCVAMMTVGVLVMKKMINLNI